MPGSHTERLLHVGGKGRGLGDPKSQAHMQAGENREAGRDAAALCKRAQELWSPEPGECVWQNTARMQPLG